MASTSDYLIASLIGGVSEQAPQDRAPSSAEDQINCINSPLVGSSARPGGELVGTGINRVFTDPFEHSIRRGEVETYQVLVEGGTVSVINLETGAECSVSGSVGTYLNHSGPAREAFDMVTVEDTSFLVNRQVTVQMGTTLSPARPNKALFYFKSGSYKTTYKAIIRVGGTTYTGSYTTPDNSVAGNAQYIATNQLASSLHAAITSILPSLPSGFSVTLSGSMVVIDGGSNDFTVESEDGAGDTQLIAFKDWVKKFTDLPARCVADYVVGIRGSAAEQKNDYWLKYVGSSTTGYWEEVVQPSTPINLNASTMPVTLRCTGLNTFVLSTAAWGARLAGDGDESAKDPPFVGRKIRCLSFIAGRLALISAGGGMLSRARNAYVFFPDTTQTRLATDPIAFGIENGSVPDIRSAVPIDGRLLLWGDGSQLKLSSGDSSLTEETAEVLPSTSYEFDGRHPPIPLGIGSMVFGNRAGTGSLFTEVSYRGGSPIGEIPLNDHCPSYIGGNIRRVILNGASRSLLVVSDADESSLYLYQWLNSGDSRVQTAWNRWKFEGVTRILGGIIKNGQVLVSMVIGSKTYVQRIPLAPAKGAESDVRLDYRLFRTVTSLDASGNFLVTLPYTLPSSARAKVLAMKHRVNPIDSGGAATRLELTWLSATQVSIKGLEVGDKVYLGIVPVARRRFSDFHIKDRAGSPVVLDSVNLEAVKINHKDTTEYSVEVIRRGDNETAVQSFNGRDAIDRATPVDSLPRKTGSARFSLGIEASDYWVDLVNDTPFPSTWVSAKFYYTAVNR